MGGLASGEWMPTTFVAVAAARAVSRLFSILENLGMGGRSGVGSGGCMPTTFGAVAAAAAVLDYLSILEAPGMGGRGQGDGEG